MKHSVHFLSRERKRNQKKTPMLRGPSGYPALLEAGGSCETRWRSNSHNSFVAPFCDARHVTKGKVQDRIDYQPPSRGLPDASRSAGGVFTFDLNPPPLVEEPERLYRSGERSAVFALYQISMKPIGIIHHFVHFLSRERKRTQKKTPV